MNGIGITLPADPRIFEDLKGTILFAGSSVKLTGTTFKTFGGTGAAAVAVNLAADPMAYSYAFSLKGVSAQEAVDGWIDVAVTKDLSEYKDKLFGTMDISYQGNGSGLSTELAENSAAGSGVYAFTDAKVKGLAAVKAINGIFKDKSDEITFAKISGKLGLKKKVFSFTADTIDKVGSIGVAGGVNFDGDYTPEMKVQSDIKKEFLDSDEIKKMLGGRDVSLGMDEKGNLPVDFKFTGKASENHWSYQPERLLKNVGKNLTKQVGDKLGQGLKSLFGQ